MTFHRVHIAEPSRSHIGSFIFNVDLEGIGDVSWDLAHCNTEASNIASPIPWYKRERDLATLDVKPRPVLCSVLTTRTAAWWNPELARKLGTNVVSSVATMPSTMIAPDAVWGIKTPMEFSMEMSFICAGLMVEPENIATVLPGLSIFAGT